MKFWNILKYLKLFVNVSIAAWCISSSLITTLTENQFGFFIRISIEEANLKLVEVLHASLNANWNYIDIFIDFKHVFDTINHSIPLKKTEAYDIRGNALELMCKIVNSLSKSTKPFICWPIDTTGTPRVSSWTFFIVGLH